MSIFKSFLKTPKENSTTNKVISNNAVPDGLINYPSFMNSADEFPIGLGNDGKPVIWDRSHSYSSHLMIVGGVGSGRTIAMRNIIKHASEFPERYVTYGVDLSHIEFKPYLKYPFGMTGIATTIDETLNLFQGIEEEIKQRADFFERSNAMNIKDVEGYHHIIVMIDEAMDLFSYTGETGEENATLDQAKHEITKSILKISSLGRFAGVSIVLTSKHQEIWDLIPGAVKTNFIPKILMGLTSADQFEKFYIKSNDVILNSKNRNVGYFSTREDQVEEFQLYYLSMNSFDEQISASHGFVTGTGAGRKFIRKPMAQDEVIFYTNRILRTNRSVHCA